MNVYMRRAARLYVFKRVSRVPNGLIFSVHSLYLVWGQVFLPPWYLPQREKALEANGSMLPVQPASRGHIFMAHRVQRAQPLLS